jgi:uncharacterized protein YbjT (DUF2867 family)
MIALLRLFLVRHVADSTAMERLIVGSNMDWTIVRPLRLLQGGVARGYRIEVGARPRGSWAMQRGDLAAYLLHEAETRERNRRHHWGESSAQTNATAIVLRSPVCARRRTRRSTPAQSR